MVWDAALNVGGTLVLVALGIVLVLPGSGRKALLLGAFCLTWGLAALGTNLPRLLGVETPLGWPWYATLNLIAAGLLITLVTQRGGARARTARAFVWGIVAAAIVAVIATEAGAADIDASLLLVPYYAAFPLAIVILHRAARRASTPAARERRRALLLALIVFPSYLFWALSSSKAESLLSIVWLARVCVLVIVAVAMHALLRPIDVKDRRIAVAAIVPALVLLVEAALLPTEVGTSGLWRAATALLLVHGIARTKLCDVELRVAMPRLVVARQVSEDEARVS